MNEKALDIRAFFPKSHICIMHLITHYPRIIAGTSAGDETQSEGSDEIFGVFPFLRAAHLNTASPPRLVPPSTPFGGMKLAQVCCHHAFSHRQAHRGDMPDCVELRPYASLLGASETYWRWRRLTRPAGVYACGSWPMISRVLLRPKNAAASGRSLGEKELLA